MEYYNQVYCEDCLVGLKKIPDKTVNLILTDPPYGITAAKWDNVIDFSQLWQEYERVIMDNGVIVIFGQEPFSSMVRNSNLKLYKYDIYWKKQKPSNFQLMGYQMGRVIENIMVFSKAKACYTKKGNKMCYNPQTTLREKPRQSNAKIYGKAQLLHNYKREDNFKIYQEKQPINLIEYNTISKGKLHPTQKPIALLEYLIRTFSNEGNVVLDTFMGSGSTIIAAINTKRKYIGFELEEGYFSIALQRIKNTNETI